ncbi:radical SAM protein [Alkalicaulis satelles]|uniref:Radical SAM protein n=1 Tax=Alkalicaulis satelles TaxID=2609175 RepID=A0A5M6ZG60_9PROT|nr:radical SAM protein [Alkalicaulis satelles]KAA5803742.1 radical SAM protein [Alkalicaulis satelles]
MPDTAWPAPFTDPDVTAKGETRASVAFKGLKTLWFNTGTLCNIECVNCYIESSPKNDRLVYLTPQDAAPYLDEIDAMGAGPVEIGFTGGEPYLNPHMNTLAAMALERGHEALVLTNAMRPMMRPGVQDGLADLQRRFGPRLTLRVSLDHYTPALHDAERGAGAFDETLKGLAWLVQNGVRLSVAGRKAMAESEAEARAGFAALFARLGADIPADDPGRLVLFPEMDPEGAPPEITTACWGILKLDPATIMCASSRMVVRRKGADRASVISCTLLPYDEAFELGQTLGDSLAPVKLKHKFCAQFCVLGGASCSA